MDDLISRNAALQAVGANTWAGARISKLPSAQPERKRGKWIDIGDYCVCNQCWHTEQQFNGVEPIPLHTPFCAMCGADMREEENR